MQTLMIDMNQLLPGLSAGPGAGKAAATDFSQLLQLFAAAQVPTEPPLALKADQDGAQPGAEHEALAALMALLETQGANPAATFTAQPEQSAAPTAREAAPVAEMLSSLPQPVLARQPAAAQQPQVVQPSAPVKQPLPAQQDTAGATPIAAATVAPAGDETLDPVPPRPMQPGPQRAAEPLASLTAQEAEEAKPGEPTQVQVKVEAASRQLPAALPAVSPTDVRFAALIQPRAQQVETGRNSEGARFEALSAPGEGQAVQTDRVQGTASGQGQSDLASFQNRGGAADAAPLPSNSGAEPSQAFTLETARPAAPAGEPQAASGLRLANGTLLPDNQLLNQVVERFNLRGQGEGSRMTLRLHPEELGELRMELLMEKGVLKAQIHAQNPQVQEVLERNLFRLRDALESQGLKLDSCEVSLDNRQPGEGREWFGERRQQQTEAPPQRHAAARISRAEEAAAPRAGLTGSGGINLRI